MVTENEIEEITDLNYIIKGRDYYTMDKRNGLWFSVIMGGSWDGKTLSAMKQRFSKENFRIGKLSKVPKKLFPCEKEFPYGY